MELNRLSPPFHRRLMQPTAFNIEAGHLGRTARQDDRAIILLGEALQPRTGVHGVANGSDDLRTRWSHAADNGLAEMNADADPQRL